jgi:hypothetical protein
MRLMQALYYSGPLQLLNKMKALSDAIINDGQASLLGVDISPSAVFRDEFPSEAAERIEAQGVPVRFQARSEMYSALHREVAALGVKRPMSAASWMERIRGLIKAGKVKQEEVDWSTVEEWMRMQNGDISPEDVADYLADDPVKP